MIIKVAVIGAGFMGCNHARVYSELEGCELTGIVDPREAARSNASKFGAPFFSSVAELMAVDRPDAVSVAVPTGKHAEVAGFFLKNGMDVMVEKPIAETAADAVRLVDAAKSTGAVLMVGHIERFNPMVRKIREMLETGSIGRLLSVSTNRLNPSDRLNDSAVLDLMTHDIDVIHYLTGGAMKPLNSSAFFVGGLEKHVTALAQAKGGALCTMNCSLLYPIKRREISLLTENFLVEGNYMTQQLNVYGREGMEAENMRPFVKTEEPLKMELNHFLDCVRQRGDPEVTGEDGARVLDAALAIRGLCSGGTA